MSGQWGALISDLSDLQRLVASHDEIDLEVGLNTWVDVAATARAFAEGMPAQARILRGENYYEHCPLKEGVSYALINSFVDDRNMALAVVSGEPRMARRPQPSTPAFAWQFRRVGQGWWKIGNVARGTRWSLDVEKKPNHVRAHMAPLGNTSGQLWRCMLTRSAGWVRLINSFQGEFYSLDTFRDTLDGFMADTENRSGQYWRFVELVP
jgi:hypothetical protein